MIKIIIYTLLITLISTFKSFCNDFIGVIGVAVGEVSNQKNEKLYNGSKIFYGDTIFVKSKSKSTIKNKGSIISSITLNEFFSDIEGGSGS